MKSTSCFALLFTASTMLALCSPVFATEEGHEWDGIYAGATFGGATGTSRRDFSDGGTTGDMGVHGIIGGAVLGYNKQFDPWVVGVESNVLASEIDGHVGAHPDHNFVYYTRSHWQATLAPRVGYAFGNILPYLTAGLAVGDVRVQSVRTGNTGASGIDVSRTEPGWIAGAGIETHFLDQPWSLKLEFAHVKLRDAEVQEAGRSTTTSFAVNIARVGANYYFF